MTAASELKSVAAKQIKPMPESIQAKLELHTEAHLGEGPVWDEIHQKLWWVDILSDKLHKYDPETTKNLSFDIGEHIGAAVLRKNGGFVLALKSGFYFFDEKTKCKVPVADPEYHLSGNRFNDGKCDPAGRFLVGTLSYKLEKGAGNLYCLHPDLTIKKKLTQVTISNGLVWNSIGDRFYFIDTPTGDICSFQYDKDSGDICNRSVIIHIDEKTGYPDGMTIDTDDKLWVALYGGGKVIQINPENGKIEFEVRLPVPKPTSCTFGGKGLNELYITTCQEHMTREDLKKIPESGSLFRVDLPFRGFPVHRFAG